MLATAVLVFREVLEAAVIVAIVLAASRNIERRRSVVGAGVAIGAAGAIVVALFAGRIADFAGGIGPELFNAGILLAAVALIGWHVIWMAGHGQAIMASIRQLGLAVEAGQQPVAALVMLVAVAIAREGSEIVLFLYGMFAAGVEVSAALLGSLAGLAGGVVVGATMYLGLVQIPLRQLFRVTNALLVVLGAGLASMAARYLVQADLLPALGTAIWDTSALLPEQTVIGQILHVLIGYSARPAGMQILVYCVTIITLLLGIRLCKQSTTAARVSA